MEEANFVKEFLFWFTLIASAMYIGLWMAWSLGSTDNQNHKVKNWWRRL